MDSDATSPFKMKLLQLSEEIVDLSDRIEIAESEKDERTVHASRKRLKAIGDELVDFLQQASDDDLAFTRFMMGSVCSLLGFWKQAEISYRDALSRWPDHVGILNELFDALIAQHKFAEAREVIKASIKHGGETPVILRNHAAVLVRLNQVNEAKLVMINCIAKFPDDQKSREFLQSLDSSGHP